MGQVAERFQIETEDIFRAISEISIPIPGLLRPTLIELQEKYPWIKEIETDISFEQQATLKLITVLGTYEKSIRRPEYERRLASSFSFSRLLGYQQFSWITEHQEDYGAFTDLVGKIYVRFSGLVVVDYDGRRSVPYARGNGKRLWLRWDLLSNDFTSTGRIAVAE